jgi:hypothetical protein
LRWDGLPSLPHIVQQLVRKSWHLEATLLVIVTKDAVGVKAPVVPYS